MVMKKGNVDITTDLKNPVRAGSHHRLLCMTGPLKGNVIYLKGKRVILGRGDLVDIQILDSKISREHAEFFLNNDRYVLTDISNQNGIIVNDTKERQKVLEDGFKIVVGQTVLKYNYFFVKESSAKKSKVFSKEVAPTSERTETHDFAKRSEDVGQKPKKNLLIIGIIILGAFYFLTASDDGGSSNQKSSDSSSNMNTEIDDSLMANRSKSSRDDFETKIKVESLIHRGRREYREGNYFRAMEEFRLALTLDPGNGVASFYNSKSKQRLDEDVSRSFLRAKQEKESKKFGQAIVSYMSILRLLKGYSSDERFRDAYCQLVNIIKSDINNDKYLDADTRMNQINLELGLKADEVSCK